MSRKSARQGFQAFVLLLSCGTFAFSTATSVTVSGRQLLVAGQPFTVQGVDYSPYPVGTTAQASSLNCVGPYFWWADRSSYIADFPLIKKMGANTVRAYG